MRIRKIPLMLALLVTRIDAHNLTKALQHCAQEKSEFDGDYIDVDGMPCKVSSAYKHNQLALRAYVCAPHGESPRCVITGDDVELQHVVARKLVESLPEGQNLIVSEHHILGGRRGASHRQDVEKACLNASRNNKNRSIDGSLEAVQVSGLLSAAAQGGTVATFDWIADVAERYPDVPLILIDRTPKEAQKYTFDAMSSCHVQRPDGHARCIMMAHAFESYVGRQEASRQNVFGSLPTYIKSSKGMSWGALETMVAQWQREELVDAKKIETWIEDVRNGEVRLAYRTGVLPRALSIAAQQLRWAQRGVVSTARKKNVRTILLDGPPGVGKTTSVLALSEHTPNGQFVMTSGSDAVRQYVGTGAASVDKWKDDVFEKISIGPVILFIDELDGFGTKIERDQSHGRHEYENTTQKLCLLIDDLRQRSEKGEFNHPILIIGSTNHPDKLDGTLRSRFEQSETFQLPSYAERREAFEYAFQQEEIVLDDKTLNNLARDSDGLSMRNIESVVGEYADVHTNATVKGERYVWLKKCIDSTRSEAGVGYCRSGLNWYKDNIGPYMEPVRDAGTLLLAASQIRELRSPKLCKKCEKPVNDAKPNLSDVGGSSAGLSTAGQSSIAD